MGSADNEKVSRIQVTFNEPVDVTAEQFRAMAVVVEEICNRYEEKHTDRVMWLAEAGSRLLFGSDGEFKGMDDTTLTIGCHEKKAGSKTLKRRGIIDVSGG